ncbi:hypothetical protein BCR39DRAFT_590653 [Naematelia encephala]|uniref:Leucine-rich repeat-containing N-terminal plant-type domain-containing protein n=1 Tax=Naematelia encephala TaxID=71784 RepID=A0A1Y2AP25_9TREE|nr:hypothetical protein BCR39DRAFT_590653 [Naematelia encephala]
MPKPLKLSTLFILLLYLSTSLAMHLPNHQPPPPLPPTLMRPHSTSAQSQTPKRNQEQSQKRYLSSNARSYPVTKRFQPLQGHLGRIIHVGQRRDDVHRLVGSDGGQQRFIDDLITVDRGANSDSRSVGHAFSIPGGIMGSMGTGEKMRGGSLSGTGMGIQARRKGGHDDETEGVDDEGDEEDSGDGEWDDDGKGGGYGLKNAKGEGSESGYSGERGGEEGGGDDSGYDQVGGRGQGGSDSQSRKGKSGANSAWNDNDDGKPATQSGQSRYNGDGDDGAEGHSSSKYGAGKGSSTSDKSRPTDDDSNDDDKNEYEGDNDSSSQSRGGSQHPWSTSSAQNNPSSNWTTASVSNTNTDAAAGDCSALQTLYQAMIPAGSWTHTTGWDSAASNTNDDEGCCGWYGVTCGPDSRVVGLALSNNGLAGPLSSAIFSLDALVRLDVSNNALTSLPDQFNSLPNLANLNVATNNLSTTIPSTLLSSTSLITLNLADNSLSGDVAITSSSLVNLNLAHNHLTSISISGATSLSKLGLGWNEFSGNLPDLSQYTSLTTFDAGFNNIGTLFPLSALTNLTRLDVRSNALSGPYPTTFTPNQALTSLYLSSNAFTRPFPSETAPPMLSSCYIMPNTITPCPSSSDLADPNSLASKCKLSCPKTAEGLTAGAAPVGGKNPDGIPVSPLPGERVVQAQQMPVPAQNQPPTLGQTTGAERLQLPPPSSQFVPANQAARGITDLTNRGQKSWSSSAASLTLVMITSAILAL